MVFTGNLLSAVNFSFSGGGGGYDFEYIDYFPAPKWMLKSSFSAVMSSSMSEYCSTVSIDLET